MSEERVWWTLAELANYWRVSRQKIVQWIRRGELNAISVATRGGLLRPRYRIHKDAVATFERVRQSQPLPSVTPRRRRQVLPAVNSQLRT